VRRGGELARLLPELGEPSPGVSGAAGQTRLFELVLGVLSRLGQERPIVLVIEDVHWADDASLDLLTFLIRNQRSERLAAVLTFRTGTRCRRLSRTRSSSACGVSPRRGATLSASRQSPGAPSTIAS
jgi:ATP/maltotriose-dependent transcriptional regulator MalT